MAPAVSPSLVGREEELERVFAFLAGIAEGAATLLLEGVAGIGKSTVWRAGVESARESGDRVLEARPAEAERDLSFAALADLLRDVHDEIGYLPEPQRRALRVALVLEEAVGDPPEQRAVAAALLGLLRRLAEDVTVVVAIDDAQWLDRPSVGALAYAIRRLDREPVRVLATQRTGKAALALREAEHVRIGPLPLADLDRILRQRLGARFLRPTLRQLEDASGGNPFYALEIAASLLRSGQRLEPGEPLPIPGSLRDAVRDRLATLSPAGRYAALIAAALAQPTVRAVLDASGVGLEALSDAVAAGVLAREREALRFTHPLLPATLYEDASTGERKAIHRRLAEVVSDVEERARHLGEAADGPDEELGAALEAAASSAAARGAPDAAARLAKHAVELTPIDLSAEAHRRRLQWAQHCLAAGDPALAETLLERELELSEPGRERAEVQLELGTVRRVNHGVSAARACYERALGELEGTEELELRTRVLLEVADSHLGERRMASGASEQAIALADQLGKPELLARALGIHGWKLTAGEPPPAEYWRRAIEVEREAGELQCGGPTHAFAMETFMRGDVETGAAHLGRVTDSMRQRGDPKLPIVLLDMSDVARTSGAWDVAARYADEAYDCVVQTGREALEPRCVMYKARFALLHGDLELAQTQTEKALALLERLASSEAALAGFDGRVVESLAKSVLARIAAMSGRLEDALRWRAAEADTLRELGLRDALAETLADMIASLVSLGESEEASRALRELEELAEILGAPVDALAARARGLVAAAAGDSGTALRDLECALGLLEALPAPWPLEVAKTLLALGGVQRRSGKKQATRETLERALGIFEQLGARLWAEKARSELAQLGGRPVRTGALTATEKRIAELVASGHSNAEVAHELFLSPKTVEWNLSKIYKKLHVRSRTELAAKVATRQSLVR